VTAKVPNVANGLTGDDEKQPYELDFCNKEMFEPTLKGVWESRKRADPGRLVKIGPFVHSVAQPLSTAHFDDSFPTHGFAFLQAAQLAVPWSESKHLEYGVHYICRPPLRDTSRPQLHVSWPLDFFLNMHDSRVHMAPCLATSLRCGRHIPEYTLVGRDSQTPNVGEGGVAED